ncbi:hypothetical protein FACS18949_17880 [Clostridia bacterium]|nr:hypothetical protein FACS18949_17880 [Clostridia bacterium]
MRRFYHKVRKLSRGVCGMTKGAEIMAGDEINFFVEKVCELAR